MYEDKIRAALNSYEKLIREQLERNEKIKAHGDFIDFSALDKIVIGICGGDGIGPVITSEAEDILKFLLSKETKAGKIEFKRIDGLTIENRISHMQAVPDSVMNELKSCHAILKGPTATPQAGDGLPNIESANVAIRKALDLFANMRPIKIPSEGIDWTFFRENTEGAYAVGSKGVNITDELAVDFVVTTNEGTQRIARLAYDYARRNKKNRVSIIQKANVIKTTDGKFLNVCREVSKDFPEIQTDEWYIDICTAKLIDKKRRTDFKVFILPNLYGDIITDEAAEFQGGVGTAGSANIGRRCAMFEAIHGSAPRMVKEGRAQYADPCSILRASAMLLEHIGFADKACKLNEAIDICAADKNIKITGRENGCTCVQFGDFVKETLAGLINK